MNAREIREQRLAELKELRERQRAQKPETLRSFTEAEEARERDERERFIQEAAAPLKQTAREFGLLMRQKIATGKDPDFAISPELVGKRLSVAEAERYNKEQADLFIASSPEYLPYMLRENALAIVAYLHRNGVEIFSVAELSRAFTKLRDFGLLTEKSEPEQEPVQAIPDTVEEPKRDDGIMDGFDLETGEPRRYSAFEIDRMSAETFKRTFRLKLEDQILARRL